MRIIYHICVRFLCSMPCMYVRHTTSESGHQIPCLCGAKSFTLTFTVTFTLSIECVNVLLRTIYISHRFYYHFTSADWCVERNAIEFFFLIFIFIFTFEALCSNRISIPLIIQVDNRPVNDWLPKLPTPRLHSWWSWSFNFEKFHLLSSYVLCTHVRVTHSTCLSYCTYYCVSH